MRVEDHLQPPKSSLVVCIAFQVDICVNKHDRGTLSITINTAGQNLTSRVVVCHEVQCLEVVLAK